MDDDANATPLGKLPQGSGPPPGLQTKGGGGAQPAIPSYQDLLNEMSTAGPAPGGPPSTATLSAPPPPPSTADRKSTRLNSSHRT